MERELENPFAAPRATESDEGCLVVRHDLLNSGGLLTACGLLLFAFLAGGYWYFGSVLTAELANAWKGGGWNGVSAGCCVVLVSGSVALAGGLPRLFGSSVQIRMTEEAFHDYRCSAAVPWAAVREVGWTRRPVDGATGDAARFLHSYLQLVVDEGEGRRTKEFLLAGLDHPANVIVQAATVFAAGKRWPPVADSEGEVPPRATPCLTLGWMGRIRAAGRSVP